MAEAEFKEKIIAFIDVLGFKKLVEATEAGSGMALSDLVELLKNLGSPDDQTKGISLQNMGQSSAHRANISSVTSTFA